MSEAIPDRETLRLGQFDSHGTTRATYDGRSIEVEHGIPGEVVVADVTAGRRPRARIVEVLEPAPDRVVPPCPYFREWFCGGCQWQQITYQGQLDRKCDATRAAMRRERLDLYVDTVYALEEPWRYRSSAGISLGRHAGFRRHASLAIVPIEDCPISDPRIGELMARLNAAITAGDVPDFRGRVRLEVRVVETAEGHGLQIAVEPSDDFKASWADLENFAGWLAALPGVAAVSLQGKDGRLVSLLGDLFAPVSIEGRHVWLAAGSFFQTNLELLPSLIERLREEVEPATGLRIADVYGGVGVFGLCLAEGAEAVTVIESDPTAIEAGRITAQRRGLDNVRFLARSAEEALGEGERYDVVIVDPPRAGLSEPVLDALLRTRPPLVLYISCLASSLARDLAALSAGGYAVRSLELFDFYPQTYHVELLAVLRSTEAQAS